MDEIKTVVLKPFALTLRDITITAIIRHRTEALMEEILREKYPMIPNTTAIEHTWRGNAIRSAFVAPSIVRYV